MTPPDLSVQAHVLVHHMPVRVRDLAGIDGGALVTRYWSDCNMIVSHFSDRTMARIDIDKLTEAELIDLNNRIVERLRFLNHMRAHAEMLEFRIGDRVSFQPQGRALVIGMLTRYNRKTVTVITDDGQHWNVAPQFLHRVESSVIEESDDVNVVRFKPK